MVDSVIVTKLDEPVFSGDWHDAPMKWAVVGPAAEIQFFSTKANAWKYAKIRRKVGDFIEASKKYGSV